MFDWSSLFLFSGAVNALLGIVILLIKRPKHSWKLILWPIFILLCIVLILFERIVRFSGLVESHPQLLFTTSPLFFILLPLMYCFQKQLIALPKYWFLHFVFPLLVLVWLIPTLLMTGQEKWEMYSRANISDPLWIIVLYLIFALYYTIRIFRINRDHRRILLNNYTSPDIHFQLFSNRIVFISIVLTFAIPLSFFIQYVEFSIKEGLLFEKFFFILFSGIAHIFLLSVILNRQPQPLYVAEDDLKKQPPTLENLKGLKETLLDYMNTAHPHLNKDLTLQFLADQMGWSRSQLSGVINKGFSKNFYDFINQYRIEQIKTKLNAGEHQKYSLEHIVTQCGFKSYVSFYRVFKRFTHTSPKDYTQTLKK